MHTIHMKKDFVPKRNNRIAIWMEVFATHLPPLEAELNLAPGQVADITARIQEYRTLAHEADQAKGMARSKVSAMQAGQVHTVRALRKLVRQIKAAPGYTPGIGLGLGIVGPENSSRADTPVLRVREMGGSVLIRYRKGRFDGIYLYCSRGAEQEFELIATDSRSPYLDKRPNLVPGRPEERRYRAFFMLADTHQGQASNISTILV